jgi:hypothetical protein
MRSLLFLIAATGLIGAVSAGDTAIPTRTGSLESGDFKVPFKVGEKLTYTAKVNFLHAGEASMSVEDIETIRGHAAYHTIFNITGRVLLFHVDDHYDSWFDTTTLVSLHHLQHVDQSGTHIDKVYDFYPERRVYVRNGEEKPSVSEPLDEGSFIYFMRSVPLEVGKTYSFDRYYQPDKNPVVIKVDRREHIKVPAGEFDAIVLKPIIKSKGLFGENGQAEVWFSDDSTRTLLRLKSKLPIGTLYLELKQAQYASRE